MYVLKVAFWLTCEFYMIFKINNPVYSPPVIIQKLCTSLLQHLHLHSWLWAFRILVVTHVGQTVDQPIVRPNNESTCIFMLFENKDIFEGQMILCE